MATVEALAEIINTAVMGRAVAALEDILARAEKPDVAAQPMLLELLALVVLVAVAVAAVLTVGMVFIYGETQAVAVAARGF